MGFTHVYMHAAAESKLEVAFFKDLQEELRKISAFYAMEEKRYGARYHQLRTVLKDVKVSAPQPVEIKKQKLNGGLLSFVCRPQHHNKIDEFEAQRLMFAFVHFYRECIRLENFAVMNYQAFSKVRSL